jgi:hypothetical protein
MMACIRPHYGAAVFPGLVVSFDDINDANFFLASPSRAVRLHVSPGQIVQFYAEEDAEHFVSLGQAEEVHWKAAQRELAAKAASAEPAKVVGLKRAAR